MAVNSRVNVRPPVKELLSYGLFSVAEMRTSPDSRWQMGVTWQNVCPDAGSTYEACLIANSQGLDVTGVSAAPAKAANAELSLWGATPFTLFTEIDCSSPAYWQNADEFVDKSFGESEQSDVEEVFWTGTVGGRADTAYPHLAADAVVTDPAMNTGPLATLQLAAANVGPTGGVPLDVVEALGKLESALSACVKGVGIIHIPCELLPHLASQHLLEEKDGVYYTPAGHKLAISTGYAGTSPAGVAVANVLYMYATGPVFMYRSRGRYVGDKEQSFDHSLNTLKRIYERTYVIGYDCCLFTVAVSTGGIVTGTPNSAT